MNKILECDYIESYENWNLQKQKLLEKYKRLYGDIIKIKRVKTDTIGLRCFIVERLGE